RNPTRRLSPPKNFVNEPLAQSPGRSVPSTDVACANSRNVSSTRRERAPEAHSRSRLRSQRSPSGFRGWETTANPASSAPVVRRKPAQRAVSKSGGYSGGQNRQLARFPP